MLVLFLPGRWSLWGALNLRESRWAVRTDRKSGRAPTHCQLPLAPDTISTSSAPSGSPGGSRAQLGTDLAQGPHPNLVITSAEHQLAPQEGTPGAGAARMVRAAHLCWGRRAGGTVGRAMLEETGSGPPAPVSIPPLPLCLTLDFVSKQTG